MKFRREDLSPVQHQALDIVNKWKSSACFDAVLKDEFGHYTPEAADARLRLTEGDGHLRPIHIISELISDNEEFAAQVVRCDEYVRAHTQDPPGVLGELIEQQYDAHDAAEREHDQPICARTTMYLRLLRAVQEETGQGISPSAITSKKQSGREEGVTL